MNNFKITNKIVQIKIKNKIQKLLMLLYKNSNNKKTKINNKTNRLDRVV
jgi:hypothetical protein